MFTVYLMRNKIFRLFLIKWFVLFSPLHFTNLNFIYLFICNHYFPQPKLQKFLLTICLDLLSKFLPKTVFFRFRTPIVAPGLLFELNYIKIHSFCSEFCPLSKRPKILNLHSFRAIAL